MIIMVSNLVFIALSERVRRTDLSLRRFESIAPPCHFHTKKTRQVAGPCILICFVTSGQLDRPEELSSTRRFIVDEEIGSACIGCH